MRGKYQKQLSWVFFAIRTIFILAFIVFFTKVFTTNIRNKYKATIRQNVSSNNMLAEVSLSAINSTLNGMIQSQSIKIWHSSLALSSSYYYNSIPVYEELRALQSKFSSVAFLPAVTRLDKNAFVISANGSSSKETFFKNETNLTSAQVDAVFGYTKLSFLLNFARLFLFRLPLLIFLQRFTNISGSTTMGIVMMVSNELTGLVSVIVAVKIIYSQFGKRGFSILLKL